MSSSEVLKSYSINIDFLDYEKKRDVTKNIVYSEGDINSAFVYATLTMNGKILNLEGYTIVAGIKNNKGKYLTNSCKIVNSQEGLITIPFTSTFLSKIGFNKFEVIAYKDGKKIVSPMFTYRVAESVSDDEAIEDSENYDVLLVLITQVQEVLDNVNAVADRVESLEQEMVTNEENRKSGETQRVANEETRISNETIRQTQESARQSGFEEKITEIEGKIQEVDTSKNELTTSISNKMTEFENRFNELESGNPTGEINQSRISIDGTKHNSLSERLQYDYDKKAEVGSVYTKTEIDTKIENIATVDDSITSSELTWSSNKISGELSGKVSMVEGKGLSTNDFTTEEKTKLAGLNNYIHPNDENTRHVTDIEKTTWNNKSDFSGNYEDLTNKPTIDVNKEYVDTQLLTKANSVDVYTKVEVDNAISNTTSIDDGNVANDKTWSSSKINTELEDIASQILPNATYTEVITTSKWTQNETGEYQALVTHNLESEHLFISAFDNTSKEGVLVGYKIVDENSIQITLMTNPELIITIASGIRPPLNTRGVVNWEDIAGKPSMFNPSEHNHNELYYQKSEVDTFVAPIEDSFIDGLFATPTREINGVRYYTADEIDLKIKSLIDMINKIGK